MFFKYITFIFNVLNINKKIIINKLINLGILDLNLLQARNILCATKFHFHISTYKQASLVNLSQILFKNKINITKVLLIFYLFFHLFIYIFSSVSANDG